MDNTTRGHKSEDAQRIIDAGIASTNIKSANNFRRLMGLGYGDALIPVVAGLKKVLPSIPDWPNYNTTKADIQDWDDAAHNVGLRTKNFPTLDIDTDDMLLIDGIEGYLEAQGSIFSTRGRNNPTVNRCALVFKTDKHFKKFRVEGLHSKTGEAAAVEFLCDGQQVVVGGQHPAGDQYRFEKKATHSLSKIDESKAADLMQKIEKLFRANGYDVTSKPIADVMLGRLHGTGSGITSALSDEEFEIAMDAARHIDNDDRHWDDWVRIGLAIRACAGTDADRVEVAQEVFTEFSEKASKHDPYLSQNKWDMDFDKNYTGAVGPRTLMYEASQSKSGWEEPKPDPTQSFSSYDEKDSAWEAVKSKGGSGKPLSLSNLKTDTGWVDEINAKYAIIEGRSGVQRVDETGVVILKPTSQADFRLQYSHRVVPGGRTELGIAWPKHPHSRRYKDVGMYPVGQEPKGHLNLFRGIPAKSYKCQNIKPIAKSKLCKKLLAYFRDVICSGDTSLVEYVLNWIAWKIQNPLSKHGVNLVLVGEQGTGKGTLGQMLLDVFGPSYSSHLQDVESFLGKFNGHLEGKLFLFVDEGMFGRDARLAGKYKAYTTEPFMQLEHKGVNTVQTRNHFSILICSNTLTAVPIEPNDRRATVIEVSSSRRNDNAYFTELWKEWGSGGREGFIELMLHRDLSNFDPHTPIQTTAKSDMATATSDPLTAFIVELLNKERAPAGSHPVNTPNKSWRDSPQLILNDDLFDEFKEWTAQNKIMHAYASRNELIKRMGQFFPNRKDFREPSGSRKRGFIYPPIDEARAAVEARLGGSK